MWNWISQQSDDVRMFKITKNQNFFCCYWYGVPIDTEREHVWKVIQDTRWKSHSFIHFVSYSNEHRLDIFFTATYNVRCEAASTTEPLKTSPKPPSPTFPTAEKSDVILFVINNHVFAIIRYFTDWSNIGTWFQPRQQFVRDVRRLFSECACFNRRQKVFVRVSNSRMISGRHNDQNVGKSIGVVKWITWNFSRKYHARATLKSTK